MWLIVFKIDLEEYQQRDFEEARVDSQTSLHDDDWLATYLNFSQSEDPIPPEFFY